MSEAQDEKKLSRREVLQGLGALLATLAASGCGSGGSPELDAFLQKHFWTLTPEDLAAVLARLEKQYTEQFGKPVSVKATPPLEGVTFAYALDIGRCIGCRRCVYGCVEENNQSRDPQVHYITVLEMDKERGVDLLHSNAYYNHDLVPAEGKFYVPVACMHCENPPCVKVCPVNATWKDKDGIVVIDYNWCIGCRCCMSGCPYGARRFNWAAPSLPPEELNANTEYFGNRPRPRGVVEKCHFCVQRVRHGKYPRCVEVCPVGARKFGNLLDPKSEIRYILENKRVYIMKEDLNTQPKFYYYYGV